MATPACLRAILRPVRQGTRNPRPGTAAGAGAPKDASDVNGRAALFYAQTKANKPLIELLSM